MQELSSNFYLSFYPGDPSTAEHVPVEAKLPVSSHWLKEVVSISLAP